MKHWHGISITHRKHVVDNTLFRITGETQLGSASDLVEEQAETIAQHAVHENDIKCLAVILRI